MTGIGPADLLLPPTHVVILTGEPDAVALAFPERRSR
ncbi:hypothetical protein QE406_001565 [Microbacterium testaceum]|nr:hypothetical protein [Microbacterium sp. SORGH_AS_0969]MDQ1115556.1 hypothetical protein [Microbacterium testaceum]